MEKATLAVRILMGLIFFVFGLNGFLNFLPMPPMEGAAAAFIGSLVASKLIYVVKLFEIPCGLLLLAGRYVPLALTLLAPVIFNIFWFHITLAPEGAPMGIAILLMELFLLWSYRSAFAPLLKK